MNALVLAGAFGLYLGARSPDVKLAVADAIRAAMNPSDAGASNAFGPVLILDLEVAARRLGVVRDRQPK